MALRSALEDFEETSLAAIPGLLGKLRYLAGLHDGHGRYCHWGMGRVHGPETAERAISACHTMVLTQLLRTPMRVLVDDLQYSASRLEISGIEFLLSLTEGEGRVLPAGSQEASQKHAMAVLHALSVLVESQADASPRGASPLPPPAR